MLCQSCGRPLPPAAQFCGECGAQVGAPSSPSFEAPDSPTVPEGLPAPGAALPPSPPLADGYGSVPPPPPPPVGGPPPEFIAGAPSSGGGGRRNVAILVGLGVVLLVVLVGLGFAVAATLGGDDEDAAPASTTVTVPEPTTTLPPVTEVPETTVAPPTTEAAPTTPGGEPSDASPSIEAFCASAEELGALLQDAIDDPFNADPDAITELSAELSEQAAALTATATPEELERITECTAALNVTP